MVSLQALSPEEIRQLVSEAQSGDTGSFSKIYDFYFPQVYRYCAFRAPSEVAEDIVAEIFVKAWEKLHTYKAHKDIPFGAWLFRVARYTIIDAYRTSRTWEDLDESLVDPDSLNSADGLFRQKEVVRIVRKALNALPRRYRDVLVLHYIAGLPSDEVARVLRLTQGASRILKFRALKKLEQELPAEYREARNGAVIPSFSSMP
ncbi:MAG: RNA polymerase sigma-70 factor, ECF subfamily [Candidatus Peregrinibacteria bacterium Greene0416_62]|nr:MAG: RNA polymerase sigma-70 factor, ECF subfamily [Candidatus Peregrinibacteria bacterium Greene0416_62]TSC98829.1 MAG: RNA polymerase sigma-70 factor, ECF subfamily [Candidatus Peregrinibacteria bacterium Greene1014_49]